MTYNPTNPQKADWHIGNTDAVEVDSTGEAPNRDLATSSWPIEDGDISKDYRSGQFQEKVQNVSTSEMRHGSEFEIEAPKPQFLPEDKD